MRLPGNVATISRPVVVERRYVRGISHSYTDDYFNVYVLIRRRTNLSWSDFLVAHLGADGHEEPLNPALSGPEQTYPSLELALGAVSAHWASWEAREVSQDQQFADSDTGTADRATYTRQHQIRRMRRSERPGELPEHAVPDDGVTQALDRWMDDGGASRALPPIDRRGDR